MKTTGILWFNLLFVLARDSLTFKISHCDMCYNSRSRYYRSDNNGIYTFHVSRFPSTSFMSGGYSINNRVYSNRYSSIERIPRFSVRDMKPVYAEVENGMDLNSYNDEKQDLTSKNDSRTMVFSDFSHLYKSILDSKTGELDKDDELMDKELYIDDHKEYSDDESLESGEAPQCNNNALSKRLYVKKLFKKVPRIDETKTVLIRSKAYVKGKVGCRSELASGNKVSTKEEDDQTPGSDTLFPGVYNGFHPIKHTKKRIIRELKAKLDLYAHAITLQLKNVTTFYKQLLRYIHPFQYQLLNTVLHDCYTNRKAKLSFEQLMDKLTLLKNEIITRVNRVNTQIGLIPKCRDAFNIVKTYIFELDALYSEGEEYFSLYRWYSSILGRLPVIDINKPIVAVIGHVNIGKTTLFHKIASTPFSNVNDSEKTAGSRVKQIDIISEALGLKWSNSVVRKRVPKDAKIADYNFTTRSINLSQMQYKINNFLYDGQLIDTPGMLWRDGKNILVNPYEKLTYSVLKDMPSGVIFCFDLSEESLIGDQIKLHNTLRNKFPRRPWKNVITKGEFLPNSTEKLGEQGIDFITQNIFYELQTMFKSLHTILKL